MQREPHVLLWEICHAADAVAVFTRGKGLEDYKEDSFLRSAVERQLIIVGEAIVQLSKLTPEFADRIPERGSIIAFRNLFTATPPWLTKLFGKWSRMTSLRSGLARHD
jgi:uncharacterized protein with HEPN domain